MDTDADNNNNTDKVTHGYSRIFGGIFGVSCSNLLVTDMLVEVIDDAAISNLAEKDWKRPIDYVFIYRAILCTAIKKKHFFPLLFFFLSYRLNTLPFIEECTVSSNNCMSSGLLPHAKIPERA